jgi:two-component system cell cycle sensor histidine kinase PleC
VPSRAARRRLITRGLLRHAPDLTDPSRKLFHYELEMAEQFAKNRLSSYAIIPSLIIIMGLAVAILGEPLHAAIWVGATLGFYAFDLRACRRFLKEGVRREKLFAWKSRFVFRQLLYGLAWAVFPLILPESADPAVAPSLEILRLTAVLVVLAVGALLSSPIPAAAVAGTLPIALVMAGVRIFDPTFFNVMIAVCTLTAEVLFLHLTSHLYRQHAQNLSYRAEKDAMFAELEQEKAISDEARPPPEAANLAKSQFLATMSHELRTPLNAILGFSELMRSEILGKIGNDVYRAYLDDINSSGQHLLGIINDILDLSRIEAGKRELREELVSLPEIAEEARSLLELKARQKNITVEEFYEANLPRIVVDEQAIRQVILNLLSNSLKFTPSNGEITIKVGRTQAGGQYVSIKDNGAGIPEKELPIVLSSFGQGSVSLKTPEQGTGLGIPIVQALIHLHGGNFTLRSQVGVGTEAIATLPAKRVVSGFGHVAKELAPARAEPRKISLRKSA